jgi:hypothetical protein
MEIPTSVVYVGKGVVSLAVLSTAGVQTTPFRPIGNVPGIGIKQDVQKSEHRESMSGLNVKDAEWVTGVNVNLTLEVDNFDAKAYALYTSGTHTPKTSVTPVTNKTLAGGATLTVGDRFDLGAMNVSAVTIEDSTGTPKTLVAGTNYALDAETGIITILNLTTGGPWVGPLVADYTPGLYDEVKGMTTTQGTYALMFEGINQVTNKKEKRILGKVTLPPASELPFISEDAAKATIEGTVLKDANGDWFTFNLLP